MAHLELHVPARVIIGYLNELRTLGTGIQTLSDERKKEISGRLSKPLNPVTAEFKTYPGKNLILIIVESLQTFAIDDEFDGIPVAPTLRRLLNDSTVSYASRMQTATAMGHSAAGQFVYNTGLLPVRNEPFTNSYASADYPSIAKALGPNYRKEEFIGEEKRVWKHYKTSISYGFDQLHDLSLGMRGIDWLDSVIFRKSYERIKDIKAPFFAMVSTLSMHEPFRDLPKNPVFSGKGLSRMEHSYIEKTHAFDRFLGCFLDSLDRKGILNNSVVVIAADHCLGSDYYDLSNVTDSPDDIPLLVMPPKGSDTKGIRTSAKLSQSVVFPTVLDIMGVAEKYPYKGIGTSLFRLSGHDYTPEGKDSESDWRVAEDIMRARYFPFPTGSTPE